MADQAILQDQTILVLITAPSEAVGREIGRALVEQRLAAGANVIAPVNSVFHWKGRINEEAESLLMVQSRAALFEERLLPAVLALHPYEVPEVIALSILMGLQSYLDWIETETQI